MLIPPKEEGDTMDFDTSVTLGGLGTTLWVIIIFEAFGATGLLLFSAAFIALVMWMFDPDRLIGHKR
jgi:hypothetical protein